MDDAQLGPLAARLADALSDSYVIEGEIGRGGMGVVYSARDLKLKRRVAIKLLPPDLAFREGVKKRFVREAQTAARLAHPHIVPIHAVGEADDLVYFVMAYVDGESLGQRLKRRGKLPVEEARRIMKETADALGLAHATGIIHRDIKPDNVLLEGTRRRVMVTDFGIAKALSESGGGTLTGTGIALGTPTYMSPEQAAGEKAVDARSDLYSLGIVAFEMLAGKPPFRAPTVPGVLMKHITEAPPDVIQLRGEIPEELAATIMRCLEKDPETRWPTAEALRRALESRSSGPYRPRASQSKRPSRPRRPVPRRSGDAPKEWGDWWEEREGLREKRPARLPVRQRSLEKRKTQPDGEPGIVRRFRSNFASYVSVNGGILLINVVTGLSFPWFLFPAIGWGIGLASQYGKLWADGYSMRDVLNPPPAKDSLAAPGALQQPKRLSIPGPQPTTDEFGKHLTSILQMRKDRAALVQSVDRLPEAERQMLPDVIQTVDALMDRAVELGRTLAQMEGGISKDSLTDLDERIAELEQDREEPDNLHKIELLERQRSSLKELLGRRHRVESQFESCVLAVQNVRFDLLRLRSAGVAEVLGDLTSATQQARAMRIDVEAAIDAAAEIKEALSHKYVGS